MPILEYACKACGRTFEFLKLPTMAVGGAQPAPARPECRNEEVERLPSGFAVNTPEMRRARVKAARRQMRESRDYKDKQVAEAEYVRHHMEDHLPPKEPKK